MAAVKPFTAGEARVSDAAEFKVSDWPEYRFPFTALDPTPGGSNLGRISWCVEILRGPKRGGLVTVGALAIWARQTRDPRYLGVVFHLPNHSELITSTRKSISGRDHLMQHVWCVGFCEIHKGLILSAYPEDHHSVLVVHQGSSISNELWFE